MNNKLDLVKYKRLAKYMKIVIRVFFIVSIICFLAALVVGILLAFTPIPPLSMMSHAGISLDNVLMIKINPENTTFENPKPIFASICFMVVTIGALLAVILRQLELILATVKDDKPFAKDNSRRLTVIGITLIIGAFIERIGEYLVASTIIHTLKLTDLSANFSPDTNMIVIGFVILILAGVFKYGCYLQGEYDSTI